ncbi:MAG: cell wall-active antibiotics response protein [candidate division KSB1 bacterium]|nr:cell wall-active antibiotics response protein [candidate division KSB1 bacterium]MDZ7303401.1 cell wall-active antibiotics response protein [candidate division KSB1 bacterium]MDZ7312281.1 cell wall-active antibiotics response protein [candidate division KSB1 bacterium]
MQYLKSCLCLIVGLLLTAGIRHLVAAPQSEDPWHAQDTEKLDNQFKVRTDRDFRLRLEVDAGEVRMSRGQSEDQVLVRLLYTKRQFRHAFRFNEQDNILEIRFDKEGWFDRESEKMTAELEVELPRAATLRADCRIKAGEVDMQLGGLRIADFAMRVTAGSVNLDFDEPNRIEMETLDLNTKIGESSFRRLGNARFRDADINGGIGEMTIDFSGAMLAQAVARVDLDIGETVIVLPKDAGTKLSVSKFLFLSQIDVPFEMRKEGRYYYTENYGKTEREFQLRISSGIGELRIERP